jgi:homoserine/homoserine lactone efflux protein
VIDVQLYITFVLAVVGLMLLPGPNVALIVANSVCHGVRWGILTVAGSTSAMVVQLAVTAFGLTSLLSALGEGFELIRWVGVVYLVYLGVMQWRAPPTNLRQGLPTPGLPRAVYGRGLLVCLTNPGVLLFYGAFFPQFITSTSHFVAQMLLLSVTFVGIAVIVDIGWAVVAGCARRFLTTRIQLTNRISGGLLITAGIGLAVARNK